MNILYLSPFIGIKKHQEIEISHANRLRQEGHKVTFLHCSGLFDSFCVTMSAFGLVESSSLTLKKNACMKCRSISNMTTDFFGFQTFMFESFLTEEAFARVDSKVSELTKVNWTNFIFEEVPVGKIGSYEFLINHKLNTSDIPDNLWSSFVEHIRNCLLSIEVSKKVLEYGKYDAVISYNRLYSVHRVFSEIANKKGIQTYSVQASGPINDMYSRFSILKEDKEIFTRNKSKEWLACSNSYVGLKKTLLALRHTRFLRTAKSPWVYSTPAINTKATALKSRIGAKDPQKIFLLTTSSQDELFAAQFAEIYDPPSNQPLFKNNLDWIEWVTNQLAFHPDWFLIVRPHPREFPNKREGVLSNNLQEFVPFLNTIRDHPQIYVNTPDDEISLYDLMNITDLHLNSTSTVGLEMVLNGIPSIHFSDANLTAYPPEIGHSALSTDEYAKKMLVLERGFEDSRLRLAINWIWFSRIISTQVSQTSLSRYLQTSSHAIRKVFSNFSQISRFFQFITRIISTAPSQCKRTDSDPRYSDIRGLTTAYLNADPMLKEKIFPNFGLWVYKFASGKSN